MSQTTNKLPSDQRAESAAGTAPASFETPRPQFVVGVATVLSGQVMCAAVAALIEICYVRLLGPAGRGQVSLCMMAIYTLAIVAGLGGEIPIAVWAADSGKRVTAWLSAVMFWGLIGSLTAAALWVFVFWKWHPGFLRGITPFLAVLVLASIPLTVILNYFNAMLVGRERFRVSASLALANQIAELLCVVILLWVFRRTAGMAVLGYALGLVVSAVMGFLVLREFLRGAWKIVPAAKSLTAALNLGVRSQLGNVATLFNYRLDVFIVNYFLGPAEVGIYALGVIISESLWQIPHAAAVAILPRTSRTIDRDATLFTCQVIRQVLLITAVSALLMAAASPIVIPLVFGARFVRSISVVWWILPGTVALSLCKVMCSDLAARGKPEFSSICAFVSLVVTVVLDFELIPRMGIQGAALASSVAYLVDTALIALALKRVLNVRWESLFIPSRGEWAIYKDTWLRFRQWLNPVAVRSQAAD